MSAVETDQWYEYESFCGNECARGEVLASSKKQARKRLAFYGFYFASLWPKGQIRMRNLDYKILGEMTVVSAISPHHWQCVVENETHLVYHYHKWQRTIILAVCIVLTALLGWLLISVPHWISGVIFLFFLFLTLGFLFGKSFVVLDKTKFSITIKGFKAIEIPFADIKAIEVKKKIFYHSEGYYSLLITSIRMKNIVIPISFSHSVAKEREFAEKVSLFIGVPLIYPPSPPAQRTGCP